MPRGKDWIRHSHLTKNKGHPSLRGPYIPNRHHLDLTDEELLGLHKKYRKEGNTHRLRQIHYAHLMHDMGERSGIERAEKAGLEPLHPLARLEPHKYDYASPRKIAQALRETEARRLSRRKEPGERRRIVTDERERISRARRSGDMPEEEAAMGVIDDIEPRRRRRKSIPLTNPRRSTRLAKKERINYKKYSRTGEKK
jgi:hypothetical protein